LFIFTNLLYPFNKSTNDQLKFDNQKLALIELFIIRVKKKNAKPQSSQSRQADACCF